jgi:hypothetical protein
VILHKKQGEVIYSNYLKKNNNTWTHKNNSSINGK